MQSKVKTPRSKGIEASYEGICTCRECKHDLARDCAKAECRCCKAENHSMIMDGIEGFAPTDRR